MAGKAAPAQQEAHSLPRTSPGLGTPTPPDPSRQRRVQCSLPGLQVTHAPSSETAKPTKAISDHETRAQEKSWPSDLAERSPGRGSAELKRTLPQADKPTLGTLSFVLS